MLSPSRKHPNVFGFLAHCCVMFFLLKKKPTSPLASPVFLLTMPLTLNGVMRYSVMFWGLPVSVGRSELVFQNPHL